MTNRPSQISPQIYARVGGVLYLIIIVIGFCGQFFVRDRLVVSGDANATANNIIASESLWRLQLASDLLLLLCAIVVMLVLYVLLKPVNKNLALLSVFFAMLSFPIEAVSKLFLYAGLFFAGNFQYLKAFQPEQLHAMTYVLLKLHDYGFAIDLIFFGCACLLNGYLLFRSGYFPRVLGVLIFIAGLSYLANSFTLLLAPTLSGTVFVVLVLALIGELSLALWLTLKGVNLALWEKRQHESQRV